MSECFRLRDCHPLRSVFPGGSASLPSSVSPVLWAPPRSLATTCGIILIFSSYGYLDVSVPHVRPRFKRVMRSSRTGLPHSDICGSSRICRSPQLFAAYHVLHRLREPRHPPYALLCFLFFVAPEFSLFEFCSFLFVCFQYVNDLFVENNGFEPLTPCLQSRCSSQLS